MLLAVKPLFVFCLKKNFQFLLDMISQRSSKGASNTSSITSGKATLRLRSNGKATIEAVVSLLYECCK